jgi:predicted DNA-binding transcriptional regulator YafY
MVRAMRAQRLVSLLLLLQLGRTWTATELAERLGVSVRTVHRDVEALAGAGVPVQGRRGVGGGFRLAAGTRARLPLTPAEVQALLVGGAAAAGPLGLGVRLVDAQLKLLALLPPEERAAASRDWRLVHVDEPRWFAEPDRPAALGDLARAARDRRRVRLDYRRRGAATVETVDPLGLVLKAGVWYLVARARDATRIFRASRVTALSVLDERFSRPPRFDLAAAWERSRDAFETSRPRAPVTVRVRPDALPALREAVDWTVRPALDAAAPAADGRLEATLPFERLEHAHSDLVKLGGAVEVMRPRELREALAATGRALVARYDTAPARYRQAN